MGVDVSVSTAILKKGKRGSGGRTFITLSLVTVTFIDSPQHAFGRCHWSPTDIINNTGECGALTLN
jgi:hypothetical protein